MDCSLKMTYANKCLVLYGTAVIKICVFILEIKVHCNFFSFSLLYDSLLHDFFFLRKENVKHNLVLVIYL